MSFYNIIGSSRGDYAEFELSFMEDYNGNFICIFECSESNTKGAMNLSKAIGVWRERGCFDDYFDNLAYYFDFKFHQKGIVHPNYNDFIGVLAVYSLAEWLSIVAETEKKG